jgi:GAF domain-containing protein
VHAGCHLCRVAAGFGARLRRRREAQHIALTAIAEQTKIKRSLLEALERDDLSQWPSGIFRRAWVRSYAQAIGLDVDATVREFLEEHPDPEEVAAAAAELAQAQATPAPGFRGLIGAAFGSLSRRMGMSPDDVAADTPAAVARTEPTPAKATDSAPHGPELEQEQSRFSPRGGGAAREPLVAAARSVSPAKTRFAASETSAPVTASPAEPAPAVSVETTTPATEVTAPAASSPLTPSAEVDLPALARLCTRFGQVVNAKEVQPLLKDVAAIVDAAGLIVWLWHSASSSLRPALVHGYSAGVVARLPPVGRDADNPTAASFRAAQPREIAGDANTCGALVVPLLLRSRCVGVLAIELPAGRELTDALRAVATIIAASLAQLVSRSQSAETRPHNPKKPKGRLAHAQPLA